MKNMLIKLNNLIVTILEKNITLYVINFVVTLIATMKVYHYCNYISGATVEIWQAVIMFLALQLIPVFVNWLFKGDDINNDN